jgi:hypothetical protein
MKVCPKCHSSFTDETLSFCLTDGTPLVHGEGNPDFVSSELSNAQTLFEREPTLIGSFAQQTGTQFPIQNTQFLDTIPPPRKKSRTMLLSLLAILVVAVAVIGTGLYFRGSLREMYDPPKQVIASSEAKKISSPLTPDQTAQIKKEVEDFLNSWKASIEKRDINDQMRHYAKTLEIFYRDSGKDQNSVRAERMKAIERFDTLNLYLTKIEVTPESDRFAKVVFDKNWVFRGKDRFSSGAVQQEMGLVKSDGKWYIVIEKDLQIYNMNNSQNPTGAPVPAVPAGNTNPEQ